MEERDREEGEGHATLLAADARVGVRATEIAAARFLERAISAGWKVKEKVGTIMLSCTLYFTFTNFAKTTIITHSSMYHAWLDKNLREGIFT